MAVVAAAVILLLVLVAVAAELLVVEKTRTRKAEGFGPWCIIFGWKAECVGLNQNDETNTYF